MLRKNGILGGSSVLEVPCFRYLLGSETLNAILVVRQSLHAYSVIDCVVCTDDDSKIDE